MSLARQLLYDLRPLFRVLEEPFGRSAGYYGLPTRSFFDDPLFQPSNSLRPSIDVTEEGDKYVVEADLPGAKKENVEVRIGDGGHSVTIEGKVFRRRNGFGEPTEEATVSATAGGSPAGGSDAVTKADQATTSISTERPGSVMTSSSSFSRTVWLPRVVDGNNVSAKLADGVLTVTIPKANDKASAKVTIE